MSPKSGFTCTSRIPEDSFGENLDNFFSDKGTLFSSQQQPECEDGLVNGSEIVAAGYAIYGSATMLVLSLGENVDGFTLDPVSLFGSWAKIGKNVICIFWGTYSSGNR